jgi:hypothetical protein
MSNNVSIDKASVSQTSQDCKSCNDYMFCTDCSKKHGNPDSPGGVIKKILECPYMGKIFSGRKEHDSPQSGPQWDAVNKLLESHCNVTRVVVKLIGC